MAIQTVAIVGVGLIGGSFALGLRRAGFEGPILGVSSPRTIAQARELGVIDEGLPLEQALPRADLVYLAQPVLRILEQLGEVRSLVADSALVTDAGSTKQAIVEQARQLFSGEGPTFIGGHPMAGKEGRGVRLAEAGLFDGATYVLTPAGGELPDTPAVGEFRSLLSRMGCELRVMDSAAHDRVAAWTSHLPQLVSTTLAAAVLKNVPAPEDLRIAGDGLRDTTRLASSPHEMWAGILETNQGPIDAALAELIRELESLRAAAKNHATERHFQLAQLLRKKLFDE